MLARVVAVVARAPSPSPRSHSSLSRPGGAASSAAMATPLAASSALSLHHLPAPPAQLSAPQSCAVARITLVSARRPRDLVFAKAGSSSPASVAEEETASTSSGSEVRNLLLVTFWLWRCCEEILLFHGCLFGYRMLSRFSYFALLSHEIEREVFGGMPGLTDNSVSSISGFSLSCNCF